MKKQFLKINQFGINLYIISLNIDELIDLYTIALYDPSTEEGYQRPPIPTHYRNIGKYLQTSDPILPSAILAAVDKTQINFSSDNIEIEGKIRIVDGQHRIEGFKYLKKMNPARYEELKNTLFPVIIMESNLKDETYEVEAFINLNSKGKKVSTDLAIRLRDKIRKQKNNYYEDESSLIETLATAITLDVNDNFVFPYWHEAIKTSPNDKNTIISINAFNNSLKPLISTFLKYQEVKNDIQANKFKKLLLNLLIDAWGEVHKTWRACFNNNDLTFDKNYNIQKGIGVNALHIILADCIEKCSGDLKEAFFMFTDIINRSNISSTAWTSGGTFSGNNSAAGFKKLANYITTSGQEALF
ncbi:hypothetical protein BAQ46_00620 [Bacillus paranthracis]|uniref:DGQHR domain-containing protein n=1 Tax=Bacillus paranthracis TaxID=2026186 RepID=UPI0008FE7F66|nr:DGQHR domain-containing protein [Bacillus paranthracis]OJE20304.1 hypothetical protein BAQ46_00620 [Bacillus paranthracis]